MLRTLLCTLLCGLATLTAAEQPQSGDSLYKAMKERAFIIEGSTPATYDYRYSKSDAASIIDRLPRVHEHPSIDAALTDRVRDSLRAVMLERIASFPGDTLLTGDIFRVLRPHFDFLYDIDPHYRIAIRCSSPLPVRKAVRASRHLPFSCMNIGDTLLVDISLDERFRTGDRILAIDGITADSMLLYCYPDRYCYTSALLRHCRYACNRNRFRVLLQRDGRTFEAETDGLPMRTNILRLAQTVEESRSIRIFEDAGCGYISVPKFHAVNSRLVRIVHKAVRAFQSQGLRNVIIDMRRNPGGSGDRLDKFISIFTDRDTVAVSHGERVRVSRRTLNDYGFLTEEMLGQTVELPRDEFVAEFPTDRTMYVGGMKYYVMVGPDTGSVAALAANILQYNGAATLVGEPLRRNAFRFGECLDGHMLWPTCLCETSISTNESDCCTLAEEGILRPDIEIPCIAAEYMTGRDSQLERLLQYIRTTE